jgi:hypothetical protein
MKRILLYSSPFALAFTLAACDESSTNWPDGWADTTGGDTLGWDGTGYDTTGTDTTAADTSVTDTGGGDPGVEDVPEGCVPTIAASSNYSSIDEFMEYLDQQRTNYYSHDRWKGIPWTGGEYHNDYTFATTFSRDDGLAAIAQEEACRLADGGSPRGERIPGAVPTTKPFWISGINTADWMITVKEEPGDWEGGFGGDLKFGLHHSNGSSRLGLHYHDFGGDGPAINLVGAGARDDGSNCTWWVLQFSP